MKPAKINDMIEIPSDWYDFVGGPWLMEQEQALLNRYLPSMFGYHLIKLGVLSSHLNCHVSTIRHQVNIDMSGDLIGVRANLTALPFQENCIDVCLLAHSLDFAIDPHQMLREVERVLTGDGFVIISGFNPVSLLGIKRYFPYRRRAVPWGCRMFTPGRVKDWLHLLGFEVVADERFGFTGLSSGRGVSNWFEQQAGHYCRAGSSIYFLVARKRRIPLNPIRKRWQVKRHMPAAPMPG